VGGLVRLNPPFHPTAIEVWAASGRWSYDRGRSTNVPFRVAPGTAHGDDVIHLSGALP
jgi:hypothetical protein